YTAVLADLHMPGMDGFELTRRLRANEAALGSARTPIVAVTANAMRGEEERCLAAGMDAYLAKPVAIERLRATLERWLPISDTAMAAMSAARTAAATDRNMLAAWLGRLRATLERWRAIRDAAMAAASRAGGAAIDRDVLAVWFSDDRAG